MHSILMSPEPGQRLVRHVGDTLRFSISGGPKSSATAGWQARLRTDLGRGQARRTELLRAHTAKVPPFGACWHDIPLDWDGAGWSRDLVLAEAGFYAAKAYLLDPQGAQHWPSGPDFGVSVHPDWTRTANTIYCAFTRLYGATRTASRRLPEPAEKSLADLERQGYAVLPPSGTLRDLARQLPHIVERLGCRILQLLPIHPTPTTYARFGRMGSPYAALDLTGIDPALVEFDRRTTAVDQFVELARATHGLGARLFLDIVVNHTGWGSRLLDEHPQFFRRESDGRFACPGAWGVTWDDLVELEQRDVALWDLIAESLLTWCRRGVDGFRCDAGYKIPTHVWQYITARVYREFPDAVFLLEGLGGSWDATENLLTEGGMQWAYSELFQNHSSEQIQAYLDYALRQSRRVGTYVHYSETHDNERLARRGRPWSLHRNRLCALTSVNGGFGFTGGVEWLASEKIVVHQRTGLAWENPTHLVDNLASLNRLLADHPAFFDGATLHRVSPEASPVYGLVRTSSDRAWQALVLINTSSDRVSELKISAGELGVAGPWSVELLGQAPPEEVGTGSALTFRLLPGACYCLSPRPAPPAGNGNAYRIHHAQAAWAVQAAATLVPPEHLAFSDSAALAHAIARDPAGWLAALSAAAADRTAEGTARFDLAAIVERMSQPAPFPCVVRWRPEHARRITLVPPGWWLLVEDTGAFACQLQAPDERSPEHASSIPTATGYAARFAPRRAQRSFDGRLVLERFSTNPDLVEGVVRFLAPAPDNSPAFDLDGAILLTNRRGGMARLRADFGTVRSKYDGALAANLHPTVPVDRHVFVKRVRAWINADGFISALDRHNLVELDPGPPARWRFRANAGDSRTVSLVIEAAMIPDRNTTVFRIARAPEDAPLALSLTLRVDVEDRSFHAETRRNPDADRHFLAHCRPLPDGCGFEFTPASDRRLSARLGPGTFHPGPEWSEHVPHPIEAQRGQVAEGDAFSPGWFEVPLAPGAACHLVLDAEPSPFDPAAVPEILETSRHQARAVGLRGTAGNDTFARRLANATDAFLVRREHGWTVIAGYPWFLDWGRDTLIAARGLLATGWADEVLAILSVFGRFADRGTLPNSIFGENASNRDTSDAPLWYILALEELVAKAGPHILETTTSTPGPTLLEVARSIADGYLAGTPNGLFVDPASALVWSPSHFTWMDTNHPAGTPREGYPVEIQALWIRALGFLARFDTPNAPRWQRLAATATDAFRTLFWLETEGWFSDVLLAPQRQSATQAIRDNSLRCNALLAVTLGLAEPAQARRCVEAALHHLLVPGAVRSLAPLPVSPPLPIRAGDGRLLNDPDRPYWGGYGGDEDTRRKPAYHNGTAWTWFLPTFCEALAVAWNHHPRALEAAVAILGSLDETLRLGCHGQLPEILDGDAPHSQRGCDAQAWSVTEAARVWQALRSPRSP